MKTYNKIYTVHAWKDNNKFFTVVQGEGGIKYPRLKIIDDNGSIDLTDASITYTVTLPRGSEEIIDATIVNATQGIVEFEIKSSMTAQAGLGFGELNISVNNKVLKIGGINLNIAKATAGSAIEASEQFSALLEALNKVLLVTPEGTATIPDGYVNTMMLADNIKTLLNSVPDKANLNDICNIVPSTNLIVLTDGAYTNKNINNATVTVKDNKIYIKSDGTVEVSGSISIPAKINLKEETECCLSTQDTVNNESLTDTNPLISLCVNAVKLVDITISRNGNVMSKVLNVSSSTNCEIRITLAKDKTYDIESNLQLEKGTVVTKFESPTNIKKTLSLSLAENSVNKSNLATELQNEIVIYNTLYVTTDLSKVDNIKTFASILAANNSIKDNNEKNRYIIKVADGKYHDLETTYAGSTDTTQLQGIVAKDYVYYESESDDPTKCVLVWNGAVGFNDLSLLTNAVALKKCIFHLTGGDYTERGLHTYIKGFTLRSLNTRYGLHCESGGYGRNVDWLADNCIIEFGGRPQVGDGTSTMPIVGMGVSPHQKGLFKRCSFKYINGASGNTINCHDNAETTTYKTTKAVINGAEIVFDGCNFNGGLLNFVSTNTSDTPYVARITNSKVDDGNITHTDNWIIQNGV